MKLAYGFIETRGLIASIEAADAMLKAAKVKLIKRQKIGSALVTIIIEGELAACQAAVNAGSTAADKIGELISAQVIPRPFGDTHTLVHEYFDGKKAPFVPVKQKAIDPSKTVIKGPTKKPTPVKSKDKREPLTKWLSNQKTGATLGQIATYLEVNNAEARRIIKKIMDEGKIEKVHQKYFFLNKRKK